MSVYTNIYYTLMDLILQGKHIILVFLKALLL